ncbi:MAG: transporter substrate-binding domain-containing protein [Rhodospirillaceae bacterium]|nr:transporter substrate-binding domain-containing protein [Rhodospirillaceae bacterium]
MKCLCVTLGLWLALPGMAAEANPVPSSITVVMDDNYPPYIFRTGDGALHGILKDTWELWSRKTGIRVNLLAMDWARAQATMAAGEADLIDTIFETPERRALYDFSAPYATIDVPIFFHKSISGISDVETLRGFTIGVKDGDASIGWLEARGLVSLKRYPSYEAMIEAAGRQEIRIFCIDQPPGAYLLYKAGLEEEFRHTQPLYSGQFHWAIRHGDRPMQKLVADGFARITTKERQEIQAKWLGKSLSPEDRRYLEVLTWALELAGRASGITASWSH